MKEGNVGGLVAPPGPRVGGQALVLAAEVVALRVTVAPVIMVLNIALSSGEDTFKNVKLALRTFCTLNVLDQCVRIIFLFPICPSIVNPLALLKEQSLYLSFSLSLSLTSCLEISSTISLLYHNMVEVIDSSLTCFLIKDESTLKGPRCSDLI